MKIVINDCYGGFGLSPKAEVEYIKRKLGKKAFFYESHYSKNHTKSIYTKISLSLAEKAFCPHVVTKDLGASPTSEEMNEYYFSEGDIDRADPILIQIVEELGKKANGQCAELKIVEIPDGIRWVISEYDGIERVEEEHRSWC